MSRHALTPKHTIKMALRVIFLSAMMTLPLGYASQGVAGSAAIIEEASSQNGGGIGFVLLMSLQRA